MPDKGASALAYAQELGLPVFPLHTVSGGRCSCRVASCEDQGKHPRTMNGLHGASTDPEQIRRWWGMWPDANIGIRTGAVSGLVVIDEDEPGALSRVCAVPPTPRSLTGKGAHYLFAHPGGTIANRVRFAAGLDVRGDGGYIVAPPSDHLAGGRYVWDRANGMSPRDLRPPPIPAPLLALIARPTARRSDAATDGAIPAGERNDTLARFAGAMRRVGMTEAAIAAALAAENEQRCDPPLEDDEVRKIAASIARYEPAAATPGRVPASGAPFADVRAHTGPVTFGSLGR